MRRRLAAVLTALAIASSCGGDGGGAVDRARRILDDERRFDSAFEAGDALANVGALLQAEGEACRRDDGDPARCKWLLAASAAAQVMAYRVLDCTAPGRFVARTRLLDHLDVLAVGDDPGEPPAPPACV